MTKRLWSTIFILGLGLAGTLCAPAAGNTPAPALMTPPPALTAAPTPGNSGAMQSFMIERARLEKLEKLVYAANPDLKETEKLAGMLYVLHGQKESSGRAQLDKYLKDHKMTAEADLPKLKLDETSRLLEDILASVVVGKDSMKKTVLVVLQRGKPVFPAEFEKQFPGKKAAEVDPEALLVFYKAQLKSRADKARVRLTALLKETGLPQPLLQSQSEIVQIQCGLKVIREYLLLSTPAELVAQRARTRALEKAVNPQAGMAKQAPLPN